MGIKSLSLKLMGSVDLMAFCKAYMQLDAQLKGLQ